jgi:hypothetical protein
MLPWSSHRPIARNDNRMLKQDDSGKVVTIQIANRRMLARTFVMTSENSSEPSLEVDSRTLLISTQAILGWHLDIGLRRHRECVEVSQLEEYVQRVRHFAREDLHNPVIQREIAREQLMGLFEWAYGVPLTEEMHQALAVFLPNLASPPTCLGELAKGILGLLDRTKSKEKNPEKSLRKMVHVVTRDELNREASEFYREYMGEENLGIGGRNVLIACSLERSNRESITLLAPEILGIEKIPPNARQDDFLDAIRRGNLVVESVTGGAKHRDPVPEE